jgi:hypothetical protein
MVIIIINLPCVEHIHNNLIANVGRTIKSLCLKSQEKF